MVVALTGCGTPSGTGVEANPDAASNVSDGALADGDVTADAGGDTDLGVDANVAVDAQVGLDANVGVDAQVGVDANVVADANVASDASVALDAAAFGDARVVVDAGVDAGDAGADAGASDGGAPAFACPSVDGSSDPAIVGMAADLSGSGGYSLPGFMAMFPTPGVSVAIRGVDGVVHTAVFGNASNAAFDPAAVALNPSTLFLAGSVSKAVTALAYLSSGLATSSLGVDIRPTVADLVTPSYAVTPVMLLSHTAGTSIHGFMGYGPGAALPTIDQILLGVSPANNLPLSFGTPGPWLYSGGGYILFESWLERTTQSPLPTIVHEQLFAPATASRSHFQQPIDPAEHDAACGFDPIHIPGLCRNVDPELAAAGLWTTPRDLACMAGYVAERRPDVLASVRLRNVGISGYPQRQGLGLRHRPANGVDETAGHFFEHGGVNYGYCTQFAFFDDGRAVVVMDNGCRGAAFLAARSLCRELGWPCAGASMAVQ